MPAAKRRRLTLEAWVARLKPLLGRDAFFVCADRVGVEALALLGGGRTEGETLFCGSSCVVSLREPRVVAALGASEEGVLVTDVPVARRRGGSAPGGENATESMPSPQGPLLSDHQIRQRPDDSDG